MTEMHTDLPKTVNEALKILAYNDYFWANPSMLGNTGVIKPHPKDYQTVRSLAESQYPWTEKQGKLALVILKRYLTKFQAHGMDIKPLLDKPEYDEKFRVISFDKSIEKFTDENNVDMIEIRFPYNKKIIQLIRCLKDKRGMPRDYSHYDGDSKKWLFTHSDVTAYYLTLIAVRYDFKFSDDSLLDDYDYIKKEIMGHRKPIARLIGDQIVLDNATSSLQEYWDENIKNKSTLQQIDSLKNFGISTNNMDVQTSNQVAYRIAHNNHHKLWINSKDFTKRDVVKALVELDCFPLIVPVSGDIHMEEDLKHTWEWLNAFKSVGIDLLNHCSWGFDVKEPIFKKDVDRHNDRTYLLDNQKSNEFFQNLYELHQMSKQFKLINQDTKIIFVRNRIPRALIKSKVKPKASLIALGGGYYATGTDNLKRLLENLPKKLYYSDHQPSSWDWHDHIIQKI